MLRVNTNFASSLAIYSLKLCSPYMNFGGVLLDTSILLETFLISEKSDLKEGMA